MKAVEKEELKKIFNKLKQNKQESTFNQLYDKYRDLVYKIAFSILRNKEDSQEIVQTVFIKIWNMDIEKLPTISESSWLYSITKNETINYLRGKKQEVNIEDLYYISENDKQISEIIEIDKYNRIISKLDKKDQEIVSLKILSNLSFKEISKLLNMSIGTVQWRYYRSLHILKLLLSNLSMLIISIAVYITNKRPKKGIVSENNLYQNKEDEQSLESQCSKLPQEDTETLKKEDEVTTTENTIVVNDNIENIPKTDIGLIAFISFFTITTITFLIIFIKNQQKAKKKVSK